MLGFTLANQKPFAFTFAQRTRHRRNTNHPEPQPHPRRRPGTARRCAHPTLESTLQGLSNLAELPHGSVFRKTDQPLSPSDQAALHYQEVLELLEGGMQSEAIAKLEVLTHNFPSFLPAQEALASLFFQQNQPDAAGAVLDEGLLHAPKYVPFLEMKAELLAEQERFPEALRTLQKATPSMQDNPDYYQLLASILEKTGQFREAAETYRELLVQTPNNPVLWMGLGISLAATGDSKTALQAFTRASALDSPPRASILRRQQNS